MIKWPAVAVGRTSKKSLAAFGRALSKLLSEVSSRLLVNQRREIGGAVNARRRELRQRGLQHVQHTLTAAAPH